MFDTTMTEQRFVELLRAYAVVSEIRGGTINRYYALFEFKMPNGCIQYLGSPQFISEHMKYVLFNAANRHMLNYVISELETCEDRLLAEAILLSA